MGTAAVQNSIEKEKKEKTHCRLNANFHDAGKVGATVCRLPVKTQGLQDRCGITRKGAGKVGGYQ